MSLRLAMDRTAPKLCYFQEASNLMGPFWGKVSAISSSTKLYSLEEYITQIKQGLYCLSKAKQNNKYTIAVEQGARISTLQVTEGRVWTEGSTGI